MTRNTTLSIAAAVAVTVTGSALVAQGQAPSMMRGVGMRTDAVFTIGETINGFTPTGIPDGMFAFPNPDGTIKVLVNSELTRSTGYPYQLANGVTLTGSRITAYTIRRRADGGGEVLDAGLAYDRAFDRQGNLVVDAAQINQTGNNPDGLGRFCSASGARAGQYGFFDNVYFNGEEDSGAANGRGGTCYVTDVDNGDIHALPLLGRGSWETVEPFDTQDASTVGLILGDDRGGAPLYVYIGLKNAVGDQSFLDRNGLKVGSLFVWVADSGVTGPSQFNTAGSVEAGRFVQIQPRDAAMAGTQGYDQFGWKDASTLRADAVALGAFTFSRPEDLGTDPATGTRIAFASTGRGSQFPADNWGTVYIVDVASFPVASLEIIVDADNIPVPDEGVRSPDNLVWASDNKIYIQEDRSTGLFGQVTGIDASIWAYDVPTGGLERVAVMNRSVVLPVGVTDSGAGDLGNWESSGIIDVTDVLPTAQGETLLLANVQAHGIRDGVIGGNSNLVQGGQLFFLSTRGIDSSVEVFAGTPGREVRFDATNGGANNAFAHVLAFQNAGSAPNGYFFGVDVAFSELQSFLVAPFVGNLDAAGASSFGFNLPGSGSLGLTFDTVVVELDSNGRPVQSGPAVTVRI